jgi:hypothetical protein
LHKRELLSVDMILLSSVRQVIQLLKGFRLFVKRWRAGPVSKNAKSQRTRVQIYHGLDYGVQKKVELEALI